MLANNSGCRGERTTDVRITIHSDVEEIRRIGRETTLNENESVVS